MHSCRAKHSVCLHYPGGTVSESRGTHTHRHRTMSTRNSWAERPSVGTPLSDETDGVAPVRAPSHTRASPPPPQPVAEWVETAYQWVGQDLLLSSWKVDLREEYFVKGLFEHSRYSGKSHWLVRTLSNLNLKACSVLGPQFTWLFFTYSFPPSIMFYHLW